MIVVVVKGTGTPETGAVLGLLVETVTAISARASARGGKGVQGDVGRLAFTAAGRVKRYIGDCGCSEQPALRNCSNKKGTS